MDEQNALRLIVDIATKHARHNQKTHGLRGGRAGFMVSPTERMSSTAPAAPPAPAAAPFSENPWATGGYVPSASAMALVNQFAAMQDDPNGYVALLQQRTTAGKEWKKVEAKRAALIRKGVPPTDPRAVKLQQDIDRQVQEFERLTDAIGMSQRQIHPLLQAKPGSEAQVKANKFMPSSLIATVHEGARMIDSMTAAKDLFNGKRADISEEPANAWGGAQYIGTTKIEIGSLAPPKTVAHELAHLMEQENPRIKQRVREFYQQRTKGEPLRDLSDLNEREYGYPLHAGSGLRGRADRFIEPYVGVDYSKNGGGTEILSKGVEYMIADPVGFAKRDPEHFAFVLDIIRNPALFGP